MMRETGCRDSVFFVAILQKNSRTVARLGHDHFFPTQFNSSSTYRPRYWECRKISDRKNLSLYLITHVSLRKYIHGFDKASCSLRKILHVHILVLKCHMTHKSPLMPVSTFMSLEAVSHFFPSYLGYVMTLCVPQNLCSVKWGIAMYICDGWARGDEWGTGRGPLYGIVT
jgi:hypothetical protein